MMARAFQRKDRNGHEMKRKEKYIPYFLCTSSNTKLILPVPASLLSGRMLMDDQNGPGTWRRRHHDAKVWMHKAIKTRRAPRRASSQPERDISSSSGRDIIFSPR